MNVARPEMVPKIRLVDDKVELKPELEEDVKVLAEWLGVLGTQAGVGA